MSNLAVTKSGILDIEKFDISSYFYTNSYLFKNLKITETSVVIFEFLFALSLFIILSPLLILVSIAIKIFMGGSVFYSQIRVGRNGENFKIIKFRTMIENAEIGTGPVLATKNDPRITTLGNILRASHIDELPQLFNVLKGEMSFVGPRPERPEFVSIYDQEITNYTRRKEVKPGITGLAQVCLPYDATPFEKIQYDVFYINNRESVLLNVIISYYTALKMVTFFKNK